jgi:hypothetical protein
VVARVRPRYWCVGMRVLVDCNCVHPGHLALQCAQFLDRLLVHCVYERAHPPLHSPDPDTLALCSARVDALHLSFTGLPPHTLWDLHRATACVDAMLTRCAQLKDVMDHAHTHGRCQGGILCGWLHGVLQCTRNTA